MVVFWLFYRFQGCARYFDFIIFHCLTDAILKAPSILMAADKHNKFIFDA
jgi:hypothetical protein